MNHGSLEVLSGFYNIEDTETIHEIPGSGGISLPSEQLVRSQRVKMRRYVDAPFSAGVRAYD
jgi:hypothetical protein